MQSKNYKKTLLVLVEIKPRELDSRLLVAIEALKKRFRVILGEKNTILRAAKLNLLPKGIIFDKCAQPVSLKTIKKLKKTGYQYTSIDEEALAIADEKNFAKSRYSKETINESEIIFTWGRKHQNIMKKYYSNISDSKFVMSGNPRITLLSDPDKYINFYFNEINEIKNNYSGRIILFPSNFSYYTFNANISYKDYMKKSKISYEDIDGLIKTYKKNYYAFIGLLDKMSTQFKNDTLIWRPHPTDDKQKLKHDTKSFNNVFIDNSFGITPWLYTSDMLIHLGCTTALEMYQLFKPVISYEKYFNKKHRNALPNFMSKRFSNKSDVINYVAKFFNDKEINDSRARIKKTMSSNLFHEPISAPVKIIEAIDKLELAVSKTNLFKLIMINPIAIIIDFLTKIKLLFLYRDTFSTYYKQKFNSLDKKSIVKKIKIINKEVKFKVKILNKKMILIDNE